MTTPRTRTRSSGDAGGHARRMRRRNRINAAKWALPIPVLAVAEVPALTGGHLLLAAVLALAALLCWARSRSFTTRAAKQNVGAKAEQQTADALSRTGAYHVLNSVDLDVPGDADHIALTPRGLAVIETKAGGGQVRINRSGQVVTGQGRVVPGDPVGQVLTQAGALSRKTGQPVTAIVCVPWMRNAPFQHNSVTFCSTGQLRRVLSQMPGRLDERTAARIARSLR